MKWMWMLPAGMAVFNSAFFVLTLIAEMRVKPNVLRYAVMYSMTVVPAMRGDLEPFNTVFTMPPL